MRLMRSAALVTGYDGSGQVTYYLDDPSDDGHCASASANYFLGETTVHVVVYEYAGSSIYSINDAYAVA
jgi:hypothetical protein